MYIDVPWIWKSGQLLINLEGSSSQVAMRAGAYLQQQTCYGGPERK